jgi:hypothetical protein
MREAGGIFGFFIIIVFIIAGIVQLLMIVKFFDMAKNLSNINRILNEFTKYYYQLNDYKLNQEHKS